jgi:type VI secretion system secreted protein VgrG
LGFKNTVVGSFENSLSTSISNKLSLGINMSASMGYDISYKFGKSVSIDDSKSVSLKTDAKLMASETATISGGQFKSAKAAIDTFKSQVQAALLTTGALNGVLAGVAGNYVSQGSADMKKEPWSVHDNAINIARGVGGAGAAINIIAVGFLEKFSEVIEKLSKGTYASNIKVDIAGIDITSISNPADLATTGYGRINVAKDEINCKVDGILPAAVSTKNSVTASSSLVSQKKSEIKMQVMGVATTNEIQVDNSDASMSVLNLDGKLNLTHVTGGTLTLDATGLNINNKLTTFSSNINGDFALGNNTSAVGGSTLGGLQLKGCGHKINLSPGGIGVNSGSPIIIKTPSYLLLKGKIVQIG